MAKKVSEQILTAKSTPRSRALRPLAIAYGKIIRASVATSHALAIMFEGRQYEEDIYAAALEVKKRLQELGRLKQLIRDAGSIDDLRKFAAPLRLRPPCESIDYEALDPKIQDTVRRLREWGYETVDSGDGSQYEEGDECTTEGPMISIVVPGVLELAAGVEDIYQKLGECGVDMYEGDRTVQGTVGAVDMTYIITVHGVRDADFEELRDDTHSGDGGLH